MECVGGLGSGGVVRWLVGGIDFCHCGSGGEMGLGRERERGREEDGLLFGGRGQGEQSFFCGDGR